MGCDSSDDEGSEAGQEPPREEGEISNQSKDSDEPGSSGEAEQYTIEVEVFCFVLLNSVFQVASLMGLAVPTVYSII